ncbi:hypothetical protein OOT00_10770 [Desulfobotulus sp. H1]|uniref:Type II secretion system protein GspC N-terminal domain-containing protein n=1 Tax=Desulfobotulus pelophilus TaxID=2823377 RepID=A0ABT3NAH9_9BACT|nr:hypothetical protein [Desulfobotulus pelophilus]MCW7754467.1 hypothetical protein [Desulfobotulus pelophilus]
MNTREKILVGAVLLALLYAGYEFFLKKENGKEWSSAQPAAEKALRDIAGGTGGVQGGRFPRDILHAALSEWDQDPFHGPHTEDASPREEKPRPETKDVSEWVFMGYMALGKVRIAVISGLEYQVGETLVGREDLRIRAIEEQRVILEDEDGQKILLERRGGDIW